MGSSSTVCGWFTGYRYLSGAKKHFYKENSDVTWEEFLATKFGLWIDTRAITDNTLHGSGRVENQGNDSDQKSI